MSLAHPALRGSCPLSLAPFAQMSATDIVVLGCGHCFGKEAAAAYFDEMPVCPDCDAPLVEAPRTYDVAVARLPRRWRADEDDDDDDDDGGDGGDDDDDDADSHSDADEDGAEDPEVPLDDIVGLDDGLEREEDGDDGEAF